MKKLYKFNLNYGRMGELSGIFVADEKEVQGLLGKEVYFGEVLGKHSEVFCTLEEDNLKCLTDDQEFIAKFKEFNCESGCNPFDYVEEGEDEEDEEEDEDED